MEPQRGRRGEERDLRTARTITGCHRTTVVYWSRTPPVFSRLVCSTPTRREGPPAPWRSVRLCPSCRCLQAKRSAWRNDVTQPISALSVNIRLTCDDATKPQVRGLTARPTFHEGTSLPRRVADDTLEVTLEGWAKVSSALHPTASVRVVTSRAIGVSSPQRVARATNASASTGVGGSERSGSPSAMLRATATTSGATSR